MMLYLNLIFVVLFNSVPHGLSCKKFVLVHLFTGLCAEQVIIRYRSQWWLRSFAYAVHTVTYCIYFSIPPTNWFSLIVSILLFGCNLFYCHITNLPSRINCHKRDVPCADSPQIGTVTTSMLPSISTHSVLNGRVCEDNVLSLSGAFNHHSGFTYRVLKGARVQ